MITKTINIQETLHHELKTRATAERITLVQIMEEAIAMRLEASAEKGGADVDDGTDGTTDGLGRGDVPDSGVE